MKSVLFLVLFLTCSYANINQKFSNPKNCIGCHPSQVKDWSDIWHSKAHEDKNELYKKVVTFVKTKAKKPRVEVLTKCAKCHNPKLEISNISADYIYAKGYDIETKNTKKVDKALNAKHTKEGISCFICHNTETIKPKSNLKEGGIEGIVWTKGDLIVGPFKSNNRAGFHKTAQKEHFISGNDLCLTCHQGSGNFNELDGYQTGEEISEVKNAKRCVQCHMGEPKESLIAPNLRRKNELPIVRNIRDHRFVGARNSNLLSQTLDISFEKDNKNIKVLIKNLTPHKVPTGFSGRSVVLDFTFESLDEVIDKKSMDFRVKHISSDKEESLSYVAKKVEFDTRLKPNETRVITFKKPKNIASITVNAWYYLVAPTLQKVLDIENDEIFSKKYKILSINKRL